MQGHCIILLNLTVNRKTTLCWEKNSVRPLIPHHLYWQSEPLLTLLFTFWWRRCVQCVQYTTLCSQHSRLIITRYSHYSPPQTAPLPATLYTVQQGQSICTCVMSLSHHFHVKSVLAGLSLMQQFQQHSSLMWCNLWILFWFQSFLASFIRGALLMGKRKSLNLHNRAPPSSNSE